MLHSYTGQPNQDKLARSVRMHEGRKFYEATAKDILIISLASTLARKSGHGLTETGEIDLSDNRAAALLTLERLCDEGKKVMQQSANIS